MVCEARCETRLVVSDSHCAAPGGASGEKGWGGEVSGDVMGGDGGEEIISTRVQPNFTGFSLLGSGCAS